MTLSASVGGGCTTRKRWQPKEPKGGMAGKEPKEDFICLRIVNFLIQTASEKSNQKSNVVKSAFWKYRIAMYIHMYVTMHKRTEMRAFS